MGTAKKSTADLQSMADSIFRSGNEDFISMTNILEAMDGEFFISDWLRSCNTGEFPAIRGSAFNYGEFAATKSAATIFILAFSSSLICASGRSLNLSNSTLLELK